MASVAGKSVEETNVVTETPDEFKFLCEEHVRVTDFQASTSDKHGSMRTIKVPMEICRGCYNMNTFKVMSAKKEYTKKARVAVRYQDLSAALRVMSRSSEEDVQSVAAECFKWRHGFLSGDLCDTFSTCSITWHNDTAEYIVSKIMQPNGGVHVGCLAFALGHGLKSSANYYKLRKQLIGVKATKYRRVAMKVLIQHDLWHHWSNSLYETAAVGAYAVALSVFESKAWS